MLRSQSENGWWVVTHPDHARLAGRFAEHWGNERFVSPEPRADVLEGIKTHDDGWAARDAAPEITKQGKPSAFSTELSVPIPPSKKLISWTIWRFDEKPWIPSFAKILMPVC